MLKHLFWAELMFMLLFAKLLYFLLFAKFMIKADIGQVAEQNAAIGQVA